MADTFTTALPAGLTLIWSINVNPWQAPTALALPLLALLIRRTRPTAPVLAGFLLPLRLLHPIPGESPFQSLALNPFGLQFPAALLLQFGFFLPGLLFLRPRKQPFLFALLLLSLTMLLTPEIVYARDLFGTRMNTIFKVYYQIWPLLALLSAAVLPADQRELIDIADRLIAPGDRILEASGIAYDPTTSLLGTWTAGHTLLGWTGHQHQWHPGTPLPDILPLFSTDPATLLPTHNIRWVLLGPHERTLTAFKGVERRLECLTPPGSSPRVYDDYAHNPEKIAAAIRALQEPGESLTVLWRPHGFAPLRQNFDALATAFATALRPEDHAFILPVFYAGGTASAGIQGTDLAKAIRSLGANATALDDYPAELNLHPGQTLLVMGARDPRLPEFARTIASFASP